SLRYCSYHDVVTGIYNRAYFENRMEMLEKEGHSPFGIIVCDVDGLKFVNDSFGHLRGDALLANAANIIKCSFREEDIVARIGGDEFAILLPDSSVAVAEFACDRIRESVERFNGNRPELPLSISVGFAVTENNNITAGELFKKADNNMYQDKIRRSRSSRIAMKQALVKALETRDFINAGHAERMEKLVIGMAALLKLPARTLEDLRLLAQFHDIGKVGIVDSVLFKKGLLNKEEMAEMRRHSEIGHRIAQSIPELMPIGDFILKHHEWWNGRGYPLGLAGGEIPLESRVLAIVDAYDAMTSERPYRVKVTAAQALEEINKKSGSQFDPELVKCFKKSLRS
ncbi:MAG TPA: diguanylate cyclase, partial [Ruminiclostridium sp.]|nr:diguanylate cyclase [Ruminiclostridium sp.]